MRRPTIRRDRSTRSTQLSTQLSTQPSTQLSTPTRAGSRRLRGHAASAGLVLLTGTGFLLLSRALMHRIVRHAESAARRGRSLDPLTGLPNRAEGLWTLGARLERARLRHHRLTVMMIDLDDFAGCNDSHGREAGDHVLQVTAARLQAQLRTGDMVCRAGSDAFMVIMDVSGPDHLVSQVGARLVAAVAEPITYHGEPIEITASLGFAVSQGRDHNPELLLDRADRALIQAKSSQRSIVQF